MPQCFCFLLKRLPCTLLTRLSLWVIILFKSKNGEIKNKSASWWRTRFYALTSACDVETLWLLLLAVFFIIIILQPQCCWMTLFFSVFFRPFCLFLILFFLSFGRTVVKCLNAWQRRSEGGGAASGVLSLLNCRVLLTDSRQKCEKKMDLRLCEEGGTEGGRRRGKQNPSANSCPGCSSRGLDLKALLTSLVFFLKLNDPRGRFSRLNGWRAGRSIPCK